ncbi:hypothetical protein ARMSODRAFT_1019747 [Armillaria solidipes]|uniref:Uncharacterized protein n=1 Tax=Armillaria solidipes TaxID=1076256 RepID=A0A2H3BXL8_9AGAR|nr:hypothetical protein ARMSODRAFT_1019747 [Armillaria solidipes]
MDFNIEPVERKASNRTKHGQISGHWMHAALLAAMASSLAVAATSWEVGFYLLLLTFFLAVGVHAYRPSVNGVSSVGSTWGTIFIMGTSGKSVPVYVDMERTTVMDVLVEVMHREGTHSAAEDSSYDLFVLAGGGALPRTARLSGLAVRASTHLALRWRVRGGSGKAGPSRYKERSKSVVFLSSLANRLPT